MTYTVTFKAPELSVLTSTVPAGAVLVFVVVVVVVVVVVHTEVLLQFCFAMIATMYLKLLQANASCSVMFKVVFIFMRARCILRSCCGEIVSRVVCHFCCRH